MESKHISKKLLVRLPDYLEYLKALPETVENVSATRIAGALNLGHVMVRKDLAKVSNGGRRKVGYVRDVLIRDIEAMLNVNTGTGAIVVGAGKLGQALLDYEDFDRAGLNVLAGFNLLSSDGKLQTDKPIYPWDGLDAFCRVYHARIGIIAVPEAQAQQVCDRLIECGIEAIWNFSPAELKVPPGILVQNENLVLSLTTLRLQLENGAYSQDICS